MEPSFRIIELKYAHPVTGARFWIEWFIEVEIEKRSWLNAVLKKFGFPPMIKKEMRWEIFSDPASVEVNQGYQHMVDATYAIERYRINMKPIVHEYKAIAHQK